MTGSPKEQLISLLGNDAVLPEEDLAPYAVDGLEPDAVVRPIDRQGISQVLKWACSEGMSVIPRGGGTQLNLGNVPDKVDLVLDLSRYGSRSPDHRPADLTATVDSGITLGVLQQALARHGQFLPLEAPLAASATIGGLLAANTSGPMRYSYGLPRDWLIGIGVVSAQGVETNAGGQVVKNVSGYDLNKLYAGSLGTLGVIVEATFKLSPVPPESRVLAATFPSLLPGMQASDSLLQQVFAPQGLQVIDGHAARQGATVNANLRGMGTANDTRGAVVLAFFAGRNRAIRRRMDDATKLLREQGALDIAGLDGSEGTGLLETLTDLGWSGESIPYLGLKLSLPPSAVVKLVNQLTDPATTSDEQDPIDLEPLSLGVVADPGFGLVRLLWWAQGADDGQSPADGRIAATISRVRDLSRRLGGSTVVEHCPLSVKKGIDVWGETTETIDIMRRIKEKFDPARVLNPGRFVGGI
ncbi:MAG: FAD-binding oxidoreductase [Chloroflexi bacterium]|nr:FAD-binding oxidoreductase [Chloroflexota bacterium]